MVIVTDVLKGQPCWYVSGTLCLLPVGGFGDCVGVVNVLLMVLQFWS